MIGGQNVLVAIMMFEGKNQDDSLIFNASSSRRGCMDVIYYTYESVFTDPNEFFGVT
jgi:DNA-directed RNA polymerase beta subunit